jgi:gliding motility-associated-like protein
MSYQNTSGHLPTAWQWQFTGGEPSTYTGRVPPEICYPAAGIYTTTLIVSNLSGVDTATHTLQVYAAPQGQNTAVSLDFKTGDLLDLKACEEGQHYLWEPDIGLACDTCQTTGFNPILVQPTYTCLVYDDLPACGLKCTYSITLENGSIYIPTGFSPNNDGYNDYFTAYGGNLSAKQIKRMQVFDRWGNVLFTTQNIPFNNSSQGWDGSAKGLPLDVGVYVYLIEIEQWDGTSKLFSGDISLIK